MEQCLLLTNLLPHLENILDASWTTLGKQVVSNIVDTVILINNPIQYLHPHSHNTPLYF